MILNDLFESRMSDLDIEYQDYKNLNDGGFYSRYKMTKDEWASKNWSLIKGSETVHEGAIKNLHIDLADKYRELAPSIEKYKDSFLAGQLYDALEAIAIEHGAELEFKRMMTGARNRAHMDYDTNPGGFQNWFWYLPFADEQDDLDEEKVRLDPKCWKGKKIGNPKTKMKGGVRVNNCVPVEEEQLDELKFLGSECTKDCSGHRAGYNWSKSRGGVDGMSPWSPSFNKGAALAKAGK